MTHPATSTQPAPTDRRDARFTDMVLLALATVLLRLPALLSSRHLTFDDGTFSVSALAMRRGFLPFRDIFSSQGPLFLALVWVGDLLGMRTMSSTRVVTVVAGVVMVLAVYLAGRELGTRGAALLAAGLTAASGTVLWVTAPVAADGPAVAFATLAVALALRYRRSPTLGRAVLVGLAMGGALSIKALVVAAAIPVGLILLTARRPRNMVAAVATACAVYLSAALPWGFGDVVDQSIDYHLDATAATGHESALDNLAKTVTTVLSRDMVLLAVAVAAAVTLLVRRRRDGSRGLSSAVAGPSPPVGVLLGLWLVAAFAVLVLHHPLWRPHLVQLAPPTAMLVALRPPPWRVVALVVALALPWHVTELRGVLWPPGYDEVEQDLQDDLRALPEGAWVLSDEPGYVWRAGYETAPDFVDPSISLIRTDRITADSLVAAAEREQVCAVLVWASRFRTFDDVLPEALDQIGYEVGATYPGRRTLYVKTDCRAVPDP